MPVTAPASSGVLRREKTIPVNEQQLCAGYGKPATVIPAKDFKKVINGARLKGCLGGWATPLPS